MRHWGSGRVKQRLLCFTGGARGSHCTTGDIALPLASWCCAVLGQDHLTVADRSVVAKLDPRSQVKAGAHVRLHVDNEHIHLSSAVMLSEEQQWGSLNSFGVRSNARDGIQCGTL